MFVAILHGCLSRTRCEQNNAALGELEFRRTDMGRPGQELSRQRTGWSAGSAQHRRPGGPGLELTSLPAPLPSRLPAPFWWGISFTAARSLKPFQTAPPPTKMHHPELVAASITVPTTLTCLCIRIPLLSSELCQQGLCLLYFSVLATKYRDGTR